MIQFEQWEGFEGRIWKEEVNVRDFIQMMSLRRYQPVSRRAKANIHGMPIMSFGLQPSTLLLRATA